MGRSRVLVPIGPQIGTQVLRTDPKNVRSILSENLIRAGEQTEAYEKEPENAFRN